MVNPFLETNPQTNSVYVHPMIVNDEPVGGNITVMAK